MTANSFQSEEFKLKCQFWFSEDALLSKYLRKIFSLKPGWLDVRGYKYHNKFHHLVKRFQASLDKSWNFVTKENIHLIKNIHKVVIPESLNDLADLLNESLSDPEVLKVMEEEYNLYDGEDIRYEYYRDVLLRYRDQIR